MSAFSARCPTPSRTVRSRASIDVHTIHVSFYRSIFLFIFFFHPPSCRGFPFYGTGMGRPSRTSLVLGMRLGRPIDCIGCFRFCPVIPPGTPKLALQIETRLFRNSHSSRNAGWCPVRFAGFQSPGSPTTLHPGPGSLMAPPDCNRPIPTSLQSVHDSLRSILDRTGNEFTAAEMRGDNFATSTLTHFTYSRRPIRNVGRSEPARLRANEIQISRPAKSDTSRRQRADRTPVHAADQPLGRSAGRFRVIDGSIRQ